MAEHTVEPIPSVAAKASSLSGHPLLDVLAASSPKAIGTYIDQNVLTFEDLKQSFTVLAIAVAYFIQHETTP